MNNNSSKELIENFSEALKANNAAIFAGAGLSKSCGYVDWKELMREIALDIGLDVDNESDLIAIAQYHMNDRLGNRSVINQTIINHFTEEVDITENHRILASLPISTYWTTNYDNLLERSLKEVHKTPDVKIISENLLITRPKRDSIVYKMHGDVTLPNEAVLTKEDYETYDITRKAYSTVLQSDLLSKTFLFIGFSFDDPNIIYILTRIKNLLPYEKSKNLRPHYCIFKKEVNPDKLRKQELRLKDLMRYGIKAVVVDDYSYITEILKQIRNKYNTSKIFISGAAEKFPKGDEDKSFIHNLSKKLSSRGNKIISGFGYQVGSGIINGVLDYAFSTDYRNLDEYLTLRPFPQYFFDNSDKTEEEKKKWKKERNYKYREAMLKDAGIAIFIYGNKKDDNGGIKNSTGMLDEFNIACKVGTKPIPVGATGWAAEEIWNKVLTNYSDFYGDNNVIKQLLIEIGDKSQSFDKIIDAVCKIVDEIQRLTR